MITKEQAISEERIMTKEIQQYQYTRARANKTGRPYIITNFGHCFIDCPANRKLALDPQIGEGIAARIFPNYTAI